jgi:hypothetical protein
MTPFRADTIVCLELVAAKSLGCWVTKGWSCVVEDVRNFGHYAGGKYFFTFLIPYSYSNACATILSGKNRSRLVPDEVLQLVRLEKHWH